MPNSVNRQALPAAFQRISDQLSPNQQFLLQLIHDLRKVSYRDLARFFHLCAYRKLQRSLRLLQILGLIAELDGHWLPTWMGDGSANWSQQVLCAQELEMQQIPEPVPGENGQVLGPPCEQYRSALFAPGYCWCCRPQSEHVDQYVMAAEGILRRHPA